MNIPEEEWIIVKHTHSPIVSQEIFDKVASVTKVKKRENTSGMTNIFAGLLVCADCGRHLTFNHNTRGSGKRYVYFNCDSYRHGTRSGKLRLCTPHNITWDNLTVLLQTYISMTVNASLNVETFIKSLIDMPEDDNVIKRTLVRLRKRENELRIFIKKALEQNALGRIDNNTFADLYGGYQAEQKDITAKITEYESRTSENRSKEENARQFAVLVSKYTGVEELTREMLLDLIEKIIRRVSKQGNKQLKG